MLAQNDRALSFTQLHIRGNPLILFNIWDAGSARAVQEVGATAIATGSWSVAAAHGYGDREKLPFDLVIANLERIVASVDLPVTLDFEGGYAQGPEQLEVYLARVIATGAVGVNFEDRVIGGEGLYSIEEQSARLRALRLSADRAAVPLFLNSRTDIFLKTDPATHQESHLNDALRRATAYAGAGANGFFAPGLRNPALIERLCQQCPLPVNILLHPDGLTTRQLADLGVARLSYGPSPYRQMIQALKEAALQALSTR